MDMPKTIVCLGDSITNDQEQPSYVTYWQELCGDKCQVVAAGVNGETAYEGLFRLQHDVFVHHPQLVTIMYGHNDLSQGVMPRSYYFHLEKIVIECRKQLVDQIWLLSPNQINNSLLKAAYQLYLPGLPKLAKSLKIRYVDMWGLFNDQDLAIIYPDKLDYVHPNAVGHRMMAEKLMAELSIRKK